MIWLIALVPAVVVLLIAIQTENKAATLIAAVLAALLGLLTGSPAYAALDLAAVVVATVFAWNTVSFKVADPVRKAAKAAELAAFTKKLDAVEDSVRTGFAWIAVITCVGAILWFRFQTPSKPAIAISHEESQAQPKSSPAPLASGTIEPQVKQQEIVTKKVLKTKTPMQRCVEIKDEAKMVTCLENLP